MKCPICSNRLQQVRPGSAIIDVCPECKGIWFDAGELGNYVRTLAQSDAISPEKSKLFRHREVRKLHEIKEGNRLCPKCNKPLKKFNYSDDSNIILDKCPDCGGIWADGGEAAAIAAYIKDDPTDIAVGTFLAEAYASTELGAMEPKPWYFLFFLRLIAPISDDAPREKFPIVTISIIAVSSLIFIARMIFSPDYLVKTLEFIPEDFSAAELAVSMLAPAGFLNFILNMLFLWIFGDNVEDRFGRLGYLVFYFCCGIFAYVLYAMVNWKFSINTAGVSGATAGVMGAYFIFFPMAKIKVFVIFDVMEIPAVVCLGLWLLFQMIYPFLSTQGVAANILCFSSIGGFLLGAATAYWINAAAQTKK